MPRYSVQIATHVTYREFEVTAVSEEEAKLTVLNHFWTGDHDASAPVKDTGKTEVISLEEEPMLETDVTLIE